jgi:vacuolar protein sorting-associated protein 13A/C
MGSTPEEMGLHLSVNVSHLKICVSPATIELMNRIMVTITQQENSEVNKENELCDYEDLWQTKTFEDDDFWFTKPEEGFDALSMDSLSIAAPSKHEKCIVEVPSMSIIIENGLGHTIPLLFLETSMNATVSNWSSEIEIESTLRLTMSYYNNMLALWEPLIELVENEQNMSESNDFQPWQLNFSLQIDKHEDYPDKGEPTSVIKIQSDDTLELLVTKTCLEVFKTLSNSFSQAIDKEGLVRNGIVDAPYVLKNDTGLEIQLDLEGTKFQFTSANRHQIHNLTFNDNDVLQNSDDFTELKSVIILPDGKVYFELKPEHTELFSILDETLKSLSSSVHTKNQQEKCIKIFIPELQKSLILPIHKADKRYFPLYRETNQEPFGIISEISVIIGSTVISVRGIVQIFNHFTIPVIVLRNFNGNAVEIGIVNPNEAYNVPLSSIHDVNKDLHFSISGYKHSTQGISWKECPSQSIFSKSIQLDPKNSFEPLYINAIRERQDVFFEVSSRFTLSSASYIIRLRPPFMLKNALPIDLNVSVSGCSVTRDKNKNDQEYSIEDSVVSAHIDSSTVIEGEDFLDYGEKLIKPGEILHLPTVKTSSKNNDNLMYIVAKVT